MLPSSRQTRRRIGIGGISLPSDGWHTTLVWVQWRDTPTCSVFPNYGGAFQWILGSPVFMHEKPLQNDPV